MCACVLGRVSSQAFPVAPPRKVAASNRAPSRFLAASPGGSSWDSPRGFCDSLAAIQESRDCDLRLRESKGLGACKRDQPWQAGFA
eukprot:2499141-Alexandrium_andersonii.AAC.1